MVRKKIDNRLRVLIENGVKLGNRTLFVVVGDNSRDQVVILHHMLAKAEVKARPTVLWCYKKELGFSSNRKKRMKDVQYKIKHAKLLSEDDPFELFLSSTKIRYCYYSETHKILGNTFGMCVLQDFEALTPNLLARTIETVEGGGLIVLLLRSVTSLKQLSTMCMDAHARFRARAHEDVVCRFNERFLLSLAECKRCLFINDNLTVLPISSHNLHVSPVENAREVSEADVELANLQKELQDTQPIGNLIGLCKTFDQAKALLKIVEATSEKSYTSTISLTAARGRGKSAALGLAVAAAVSFGYSNIFVTSPSPENLKTFFEFVFKGFDALEYKDIAHYSIIQSTNPKFNKAIVRVNIFVNHRQTIQYISPTDSDKLSQAELLVIDEAAAIPLPYVKAMLGPYLVFLASTINGYEGTGRSLSLKLLEQLRKHSAPLETNYSKPVSNKFSNITGRTLHEVTLEESIRYRPGDEVESWLTKLLCLDATSVAPLKCGLPAPDMCDLYYINRDTLFSYHKVSEQFLQKLVALYVSSHHKNTPNDLQTMSDAPDHHLFCLLGPTDPRRKILPEILVIIHVCLEGEISNSTVVDGLSRGKQAAGDLIPWTVSQEFDDTEFPRLSGARIVRIATHPDYQGLKYGSRALKMLKKYYEFEIPCVDEVDEAAQEIATVNEDEVGLLEETITPRKSLPPLLSKLSERPPEKLNYLGVSYGLTEPLLKFWKRAGYVPVYLRQTANDLTGEHSCIMLNVLHAEEGTADWLSDYFAEFKKSFVDVMLREFRTFPSSLALDVLVNSRKKEAGRQLSRADLELKYFSTRDVKRLDKYSKNLIDFHRITNLMQTLAKIYFLDDMGEVQLSVVQSAILLGIGLQGKTVDQMAAELDLPATQLLGLFNRTIRRCVKNFYEIFEKDIKHSLDAVKDRGASMTPLVESLHDELEKGADELRVKQNKEKKKLQLEDLKHLKIQGSEDEWAKVHTRTDKKFLISIKSSEKRMHENIETVEPDDELPSKQKKKKKHK